MIKFLLILSLPFLGIIVNRWHLSTLKTKESKEITGNAEEAMFGFDLFEDRK